MPELLGSFFQRCMDLKNAKARWKPLAGWVSFAELRRQCIRKERTGMPNRPSIRFTVRRRGVGHACFARRGRPTA